MLPVLAFRAGEENHQLTQNFVAGEFKCRDGAPAWFVSPDLVDLLEKIRRKASQKRHSLSRAMMILSGFRTHEHNQSCGGAKNSFHLVGMAADIRMIGIPPDELAAVAVECGAGGVGIYPTFTHVDVGPRRSWGSIHGGH